ncbi:MAG: hypothetical protein IPN53_13280 [Comamonadaceae bacterium]|nr:hypothetical protein [Comamonadaceae bacterium]
MAFFCSCESPGKADPPVKYDPNYQVSYTRKDVSSTKFVQKENLPEVRKQLKNCGCMTLLMPRWIRDNPTSTVQRGLIV